MTKAEIQVDDGERELVSVAFFRHSLPFALALTDRAVYISELKRWTISNKMTVQRVPIEQITRIAVHRIRLAALISGSVCLTVSGIILTYFMIRPLLIGNDAELSLVPIGMVIGGIALPFIARRRRTLRIEFVGRKPYQWKQPLFMAAMTRDHVEYLMERIVKGFRSLRMYVHEEN